MRSTVLNVEDDPRIRTAVQRALEDEGFDVVEAATGEDALGLFPTLQPDLVLVDLRLPGMSGMEVVRRLRESSGVPIVIVSARTDSHDVVAGLEAGADDYVTKPFVVQELAARLRAHRRRATRAADGNRRAAAAPIRIGGWELRADEVEMLVDGVPLPLTKTEFLLLRELMENVGIVLSREHLLEQVWGYDFFGDVRLVDAHVRRLRIKLETDPARPARLLTVRGLGYKLVA